MKISLKPTRPRKMELVYNPRFMSSSDVLAAITKGVSSLYRANDSYLIYLWYGLFESKNL